MIVFNESARNDDLALLTPSIHSHTLVNSFSIAQLKQGVETMNSNDKMVRSIGKGCEGRR